MTGEANKTEQACSKQAHQRFTYVAHEANIQKAREAFRSADDGSCIPTGLFILASNFTIAAKTNQHVGIHDPSEERNDSNRTYLVTGVGRLEGKLFERGG